MKSKVKKKSKQRKFKVLGNELKIRGAVSQGHRALHNQGMKGPWHGNFNISLFLVLFSHIVQKF